MTAQQLPEAAQKHANREAMQAVMAAGYGGMQVWHVEAIVERAIRAFLAKATGPDLLSLAVERMGDEERVVVLTTEDIRVLRTYSGPVLRGASDSNALNAARAKLKLATPAPGEEK